MSSAPLTYKMVDIQNLATGAAMVAIVVSMRCRKWRSWTARSVSGYSISRQDQCAYQLLQELGTIGYANFCRDSLYALNELEFRRTQEVSHKTKHKTKLPSYGHCTTPCAQVQSASPRLPLARTCCQKQRGCCWIQEYGHPFNIH